MYFLSDGPFKTYLVRHSWLLPEGSREDLSYPTSSRARVITPLSWTPVALDSAEVKHRIELQIKSKRESLFRITVESWSTHTFTELYAWQNPRFDRTNE